MRRSILGCIVFFLLAAAGPAWAEREARLLRYADIHADRIAFVHAGDIWTVAATGGTARRLTSHHGQELFPKFSPDGRWIAFSAEYSGNRQIWVMESGGGPPRQLTFYNDVGPMPPRGGFDNQVLDWTPDGAQVLFRANRLPWGVRMGRPYLVPFEGGMERPLAVPESGGGMFSPDGTKLVYTPISREFRTWKRYRGGRAQDVWIYDLQHDSAERITDFEGTDNQPLWVGDKIYFTSDRDGRLNLHAYDPRTGVTRRVTDHTDFDVLWPSAGPSSIVYECGGLLHRFDVGTERSEQIEVRIGSDFPDRLPRYSNVSAQISAVGISPTGKRAVLAARGEIFTVPAEHGEIRNLTRTPGIREMSPAWSPDGRSIAYLGDRSGEYEIYLRNADGSGEERRVTSDGNVWRLPPAWSPDSRRLAFGDRASRLVWVDVESGKEAVVDRGDRGVIGHYRWSPDSRWLVYAKDDVSRFSSVFLYSTDSGETTRLTGSETDDYEPVFDPSGRYLYFLSDRDYNLTFSGYEFNYLYTEPTRIYAMMLREDVAPLLAPKSDEESPADAPSAAAGKDAEQQAASDGEPLRIDFDGLTGRVVALPAPSGRYDSLAATAGGLLFLDEGGDGPATLKRFEIEDEKVETILEGVAGYDVSRDGKKLLYARPGGEELGIVDLAPDRKAGDGRLDLARLEAEIDPPAEWAQIFADGWRITRDWFYDPGMHGVDWQALRERYEPLVADVDHRADLDYILGELGGELNAGHFYVNSGDMPRVERRDGGLLGAEIEADPSGYYRVARIFAGENWHPELRSPLTEPGSQVREGEWILAVDGRSTRGVRNFYELLANAAGRTVTLRVHDVPELEGSREVPVRPIARETSLRYLDWVSSRRELVERLSGGRIGYVHLPDTATDGNRELRKHFYPQVDKDALIFDVRYNGGGFIPDRMIELVGRTRLSYWARRGVEPSATPAFAHDGPKVCLINAYSSSGGDAFPYYFRKLGLGQLIGSRTWGGLIGLSGNAAFTDGGSVSVPTFRFMDTVGNWQVENVGVEPDIEVLDRPDLVAAGRDPTLEKAVEVLLAELERRPPPRVPAGTGR